MSYRVTIDGQSWTTDDLILDEACKIEEEVGSSWHTMEPINSAKHARAILTTFLARTVGHQAAKMRVGTMTIRDVLACISLDSPAGEADEAPKAEDPSPSPSQSESSPSE